jgi:apolipoprotein D and lipocalin family protein
MKKFTLLLLTFILVLCKVPEEMKTDHIPIVPTLDLERYLGTWYEIARLPHKFEKDLQQVTATYSLRDDGKIRVLNKGFNTKKEEWNEAEGKAWIPDPGQPARLRVSFFWIFAADYRVIALDTVAYQYAMVTSSSKEYLWILARQPQLDAQIYDQLLAYARQQDFDLSELIKVAH